MTKPASREEVRKLLQNLARPIDLPFLEAEGVLTRHGSWYEVDNLHEMPAYMRQQVHEIQVDSSGRVLIKFSHEQERAKRLLKQMTPKPRAPKADPTTDDDTARADRQA